MTGLGPEMVKRYYVLYRDADAARWRVPHLHNNALQFAAANGIFAARGLSRARAPRHRPRGVAAPNRAAARGRRALLAGTILASVALFVAGFFEYNFGDTEVEMATLLVWAMPFSAATAPAEVPPIRMSPMFPSPVPAPAPPRPYTVSELLSEVGQALQTGPGATFRSSARSAASTCAGGHGYFTLQGPRRDRSTA